MSNLGWYQVMTTAAKKVGGPLKLAGLVLGSGIVIGGGTVFGGQAVAKKIGKKLDEKKREAESAVIYRVHTEGKSNEGLLFSVDDTFKVLEIDGDAALIEKIGDENNPYFVSGCFLESISDYKHKA